MRPTGLHWIAFAHYRSFQFLKAKRFGILACMEELQIHRKNLLSCFLAGNAEKPIDIEAKFIGIPLVCGIRLVLDTVPNR